jgi:hypothetical protein
MAQGARRDGGSSGKRGLLKKSAAIGQTTSSTNLGVMGAICFRTQRKLGHKNVADEICCWKIRRSPTMVERRMIRLTDGGIKGFTHHGSPAPRTMSTEKSR